MVAGSSPFAVVDKCHLLVSRNNILKIKIGHFDITNSKSEKLLRVQFSWKLSFDGHVAELYKKASWRIHALSRVAAHTNTSKRRSLNHNLAVVPLYRCVIVMLTIAN